jgi:Histidine kinase-, DNA gyrase B-, and HSP90-like ATPase
MLGGCVRKRSSTLIGSFTRSMLYWPICTGQDSRRAVLQGWKSPGRLLDYIEVSGWIPIDARLRVSDVAGLAQKLGGEQLYGNDSTAPLRELIQNAADAIRARRALQDLPGDWGQIKIQLGEDDLGPWVEVKDTGIGMSEEVLRGPLLDFGTSYWDSTLMKEEHEGLWAKGFEPAGRFGIGFFSVFMLGHRVRVTTRRFDDGAKDTRLLEFKTGLQARPLLRPAKQCEQLPEGGTCVRVWLNKKPTEPVGGLLYASKFEELDGPVDLKSLCAWLAPSIDVDVYAEHEGQAQLAVSASDWVEMPSVEFIQRLGLGKELTEEERAFASILQIIRDSDGKAVGRIAAYKDDINNGWGVITIGGLRAGVAGHNDFMGIMTGYAVRAARDRAAYYASQTSLASWATEQAELIFSRISDLGVQLRCSSSILRFDGYPGRLPIVIRQGNFLSQEDIASWESAPDEVAVCMGHDGIDYFSHVLVSNYHMFSWREGELFRAPDDIVRSALSKAWKCSVGDLIILRDVNYVVGVNIRGIAVKQDYVTVFRRP